MNLKNPYITDVECDGLLEELTKLHVLSTCFKDDKGKYRIVSTNKKEDVFKLLENPDNTIVGHNFIGFDIPAIKILYPEIQIKAKIIDTLMLSYYLYSEKDEHGLESWGEFFGVPKIEIKPEEWKGPLKGETQKEFQTKMTNRCETDCKINTNLWVKILKYLKAIYGNDEKEIIRVIEYLNFKATCLHIQDQNPILIDLKKCEKNLAVLDKIIEEKTKEVEAIMPPVPIIAKKTKPKVLYKKDGTVSANGEKWFDLLKEQNFPENYDGVVEVKVGEKSPNANSPVQMKDFLFSKGWKPKIFKDGANGKVPQLRDDDKNLCPSIKKLINKYPELEALDGLSVAVHRAGYLRAFLEKSNKDGYAKAWAHGFTRTMRLKHVKPFVNLPKPDADYGEYVRSVMIAPKGYVCIGADLASIEDKCKQISIYYLDHKYVETMNTPGWDAHLTPGLKAGMFTEDEVQFYKWFDSKGEEGECPKSFKKLSKDEQEEAFAKLKKKRAKAKTTNYAATYGAGAKKISESGDMTLKEAKELHKTYWDLNWSVKRFARERVVRKIKGHNWLRLSKKVGGIREVNSTEWVWNEYSRMWLYLKNDKDRFSACNQSFGVYVFDVWLWQLIDAGIKPSFQSHDEAFWYCLDDKKEIQRHKDILEESVIKLNKIFKPPVPLEISYRIGKNYSEVH